MVTTRGGASPATVARYLFGLTLLLFVVSSLFPSLRVWGLSAWAHFPIYLPALLAIGGILVAVIEYYWTDKHKTHDIDPSRESTSRYFLLSFVILCFFGALLYFLRGRTHFLGDGNSLLTDLASPQPVTKTREIGAGMLLEATKKLIGGNTVRTAELAYQIVSIGAGVCFAAIAILGSGLLLRRTRERLVMSLGLLSIGSSLMFFGYVENYAPFAVSILLFGMFGLLIAENRANKWLILIPLALTCFFHILGILLVPAALYLIVGRTKLAARMSRASRTNKSLVVGTIVVLGLVAFGYLYQTDYYFRFAFVPILPDRFSIKGYSLFSISHIADVINLLFLLVPGLLLIFALFRMQPMKKLFETQSARFLLMTALSTLFAVCVLDPKLGMPRDWDLFSFPAIPITLLALWLLLARRSRSHTHITIAILFVVLAALSLLPRATVQALPDRSVALFTNYLELDPARARTGMYNLDTYFVSHGDTAAALRSEEKRRSLFPYENYIRLAHQAASKDQIGTAKSYALLALNSNSTYADSWLTLAMCYIAERKYDSALEATRVADGLNPYNSLIRNEMALSYSYLRNTDAAIKIWLDLMVRDTTEYGAPFNLARLYQLRGDKGQYVYYLTIAAQRADAPPDLSLELAKYLLGINDLQNAAVACRQSLAKGGDTAQVTALAATNPKLADALSLTGRRP